MASDSALWTLFFSMGRDLGLDEEKAIAYADNHFFPAPVRAEEELSKEPQNDER